MANFCWVLEVVSLQEVASNSCHVETMPQHIISKVILKIV
jgi:hypothetical protein